MKKGRQDRIAETLTMMQYDESNDVKTLPSPVDELIYQEFRRKVKENREMSFL